VIRQLRIRNLKCFENETIGADRLNLLTGLNGTGKSTVLQALLLLRQSAMQGLLPSIGLALNGDLVRLGTAKDALFSSAQEDVIGLEITLDEGQLSWSFAYDQAANVLRVADSVLLHGALLQSALFRDDFHYLQAERIGPRTSFETSDFDVRVHRQLGKAGEYAVQFLEQFGDESVAGEPRLHPNAVSSKLRDQVEAWLGEVSPGTRLEVRATPETDAVTLRFSFAHERAVATPFRATNVGFGLTYVLPIIVAALALTQDALLIVENPEAHLHPQGQSSVAGLLARAASCGVQVFVETHSDHVLNGVRLAVKNGLLTPEQTRIHFFQPRNTPDSASQVIPLHIDPDGRIDVWPPGFFDEWDKSLEALLTVR